MDQENLEDLVIIEDKTWLEKIKDFPASYYLVAVNLIVFLVLHITNSIEPYWWISRFAKISSNIAINHEYYRLFTAIFTHEAIMHLVFNSMAIIILGQAVEKIFGKKKFILIFLISGLFGSLSSFVFSASPAIGASGGVFGMFGVHLYLFIKNKNGYLESFGKEMLQLLIINVIIGFAIPNIDYWGHFGGILGGFLATSMLGLGHKIRLNTSLGVLGVFTIVLFSTTLLYFGNVYSNFSDLMETEVENANIALNNNDLKALKKARDTIENNRPLLPPIPIESLTDQIDYYIKNLE